MDRWVNVFSKQMDLEINAAKEIEQKRENDTRPYQLNVSVSVSV